MNKEFQKKLDELAKLDGYQKPKKVSGSLKLDSNENFAIGKQFQSDLIVAAKKRCDVREYPLGGTEKLVVQLSKFLKVPANMIGVGNGSDQQFLSKSKNADVIYIDSPNNPTGFQFSKNDIKKIIKKFKGPIIIDEAYGEFSDYSTVNLVKNNDNLIVIRTFSKAFGLAGLRLGYFVANKKFTDIFSRVIQYPYPLNSFAIEAGILALQKSKQISSIFSLIKIERERIIKNLRSYDIFNVFDSKANFVLFDAEDLDERVYNALTEQGITIRKLGKLGKYEGCLRVTVGTKEMNSKFLLAIRDLVR